MFRLIIVGILYYPGNQQHPLVLYRTLYFVFLLLMVRYKNVSVPVISRNAPDLSCQILDYDQAMDYNLVYFHDVVRLEVDLLVLLHVDVLYLRYSLKVGYSMIGLVRMGCYFANCYCYNCGYCCDYYYFLTILNDFEYVEIFGLILNDVRLLEVVTMVVNVIVLIFDLV